MKWFSKIRCIVAALVTLSQAVFVLEVGAQCPGPAQRTVLINLQRANVFDGTRAGQIPLTDTCGNQRYVRQVQINLDTINYIPTQTGNTANLSEFVFDTTGVLWYIDWKGDAIQMAAGGTCDQDWLQIADASCPEAVTDSIYHQKYAAVGARYVWPGATFLVNDSSGVNGCLMVIQGARQNKLAFYDILNEQWTMLHGNNTDMSVYVPQDGAFTVTTASGTPDAATADVPHFQVNTLDSTVTLNQYPNTRMDTQAVANFLYTDDMGTVRSQSVDSFPGGVNIYNSNGFIDNNRSVFLAQNIGLVFSIDTGSYISLIYPNNSDAFTVYGASPDETVWFSKIASPNTNCYHYTNNLETSSYFVNDSVSGYSYLNSSLSILGYENSESNIFNVVGFDIGTGEGLYLYLGGNKPNPGQILQAGADQTFYFADLDTASVNIYNDNGIINGERIVTVADENLIFDLASAPAGFNINSLTGNSFEINQDQIRFGDVGGAADGIGFFMDAATAIMGDYYGIGNTYVATGNAGNYVRTDASNLQQTPSNTLWTIIDGSFFFDDQRATKPGVEYALASYGPDFTDSTLIHRRYAAQMISDSLNAGKGGIYGGSGVVFPDATADILPGYSFGFGQGQYSNTNFLEDSFLGVYSDGADKITNVEYTPAYLLMQTDSAGEDSRFIMDDDTVTISANDLFINADFNIVGGNAFTFSSPSIGTATLVAGSVVVACANVTATSQIFLSYDTIGGTPGFLSTATRSAGISFTITSTSGSDTSTVSYIVIN